MSTTRKGKAKTMYAELPRGDLERAYLRCVIADHCRKLSMNELREVWRVAAPLSLLREIMADPKPTPRRVPTTTKKRKGRR